MALDLTSQILIFPINIISPSLLHALSYPISSRNIHTLPSHSLPIHPHFSQPSAPQTRYKTSFHAANSRPMYAKKKKHNERKCSRSNTISSPTGTWYLYPQHKEKHSEKNIEYVQPPFPTPNSPSIPLFLSILS